MVKKKNPVIEKARQEGKAEGFELGKVNGRDQATLFFFDFLDNLDQVPGIGKKTAYKLANHFLANYKMDAYTARQEIAKAKRRL